MRIVKHFISALLAGFSIAVGGAVSASAGGGTVSALLGGLGIHRFLAGKVGTCILWLLTGGCFGIGWLVDLIMVCTGKFTKNDGTPWVIG